MVYFHSDHPARSQRGACFQTRIGSLTIADVKFHSKAYRVRFEGFSDRDSAESIRGLKLYAEPIEASDGFWVHELVGSVVVDRESRQLGKVVSVDFNPASDILVLEPSGMIPLSFVESFENSTLLVDAPIGVLEGLLLLGLTPPKEHVAEMSRSPKRDLDDE